MSHRCTHVGIGMVVLLVMGLSVYSSPVPAADPLIVGIPHSESYTYATMMRQSFDMALTKINKEGGINGRPLKLVYADDRGERDAGEAAVRQLVSTGGAVMLVGAYQSSNTVYMGRVANAMKTPFLVCTAADDRITQRKWRYVYRLNPPASDYAKGLEDFLKNRVKPRSMAIVYENSPYGTGGAMQMMWFCRENDIEIRAIIPYHKERARTERVGASYFQRLLAPLKENPPDVVYMVSYLADGALLVKSLKQFGVNALLCGGAGGFTHQKFIDKAGAAGEYLLTATLWCPGLPYPGAGDYYDRYRETYGVAPDYHGVEAYSALLVAADALRRAASTKPEDVLAALDNTDTTTPFGPVSFNDYGKFERQNRVPTMVLQVIDGKFDCVWPRDLSTAAFQMPPGWRRSP
ncbi:ABC transporter, substrate-binding protein (cluster 4, leucine/isoleucine/valine/benzoate) [Olavius algarvensis associated proteobacterium Delta 3]|nr:ABC transporter, substrate-binding protein (cluster 4, leucine/isoleucine/valine/benzoate) [Olavius algarvensis associated proteobacterium Delta 3]CAB5146593.1 ABC transporter, substrate-binding protein (cluster 4, leucine/isoleucine/valine/benzoate) [Olavius algarvensis associated proteobacterium Delta 3]